MDLLPYLFLQYLRQKTQDGKQAIFQLDARDYFLARPPLQAKAFGISPKPMTFNRIIRVLSNAGYVQIERHLINKINIAPAGMQFLDLVAQFFDDLDAHAPPSVKGGGQKLEVATIALSPTSTSLSPSSTSKTEPNPPAPSALLLARLVGIWEDLSHPAIPAAISQQLASIISLPNEGKITTKIETIGYEDYGGMEHIDEDEAPLFKKAVQKSVKAIINYRNEQKEN